MITRVIIAAIAVSIVAPITFGQMKYSRPRSQSPTPSPTPTPTPQSQQRLAPVPAQSPMRQQRTVPPQPGRPMLIPPKEAAGTTTIQPRSTPALALIPPRLTSTPAPAKPSPTPVPPPDVNAYLDRQLANSKDKKFHMTVNGKDLALTPFHVWPQKSTGPNTTSTSISMRSDEAKVYDIEFVTAGAQVTGIRIQRINGEAVR